MGLESGGARVGRPLLETWTLLPADAGASDGRIQ